MYCYYVVHVPIFGKFLMVVFPRATVSGWVWQFGVALMLQAFHHSYQSFLSGNA